MLIVGMEYLLVVLLIISLARAKNVEIRIRFSQEK